jgi:hypothetical protein
MPELTPRTIWTDMRGNFSPYPTLTCNQPWDADKPWPPVEPVPAGPSLSGVSHAPGWTPGPWGQSHRKNERTGMYSTEVYDAAGQTIATFAWHERPGVVSARQHSTDRTENAQLCATAPDLYAALDDLTDITVCIDGPIGTDPQFFSDLRNRTRRALDVMAKARGEKPNAT